MKKILLILCVCLIASFANAQVNIKDMARADKAIALISSEMSELKAPQIKFVKQALLNKYMSNRKATSGKGLSSEEKKNIFKISREKTKNSLLNNFSKSQVNNILKFEGQSFRGSKNTKGKIKSTLIRK